MQPLYGFKKIDLKVDSKIVNNLLDGFSKIIGTEDIGLGTMSLLHDNINGRACTAQIIWHLCLTPKYLGSFSHEWWHLYEGICNIDDYTNTKETVQWWTRDRVDKHKGEFLAIQEAIWEGYIPDWDNFDPKDINTLPKRLQHFAENHYIHPKDLLVVILIVGITIYLLPKFLPGILKLL